MARGYYGYDGGGHGGGWGRYVPVGERREKAAREATRLAKKHGRSLAPVKIEGRKIAHTFWGQAWCENLEAYRDYENRLPRGRTYARNGSVIDLEITPGKIAAIVSGSRLYDVTVTIKAVTPARFATISRECSGKIDSVVELLRGELSNGVMEVMTRQQDGLFPAPAEIDMDCSCPDYAGMCKHIAAVLYGVGARLDEKPELLFVLRKVDHLDLISQAATSGAAGGTSNVAKEKVLAADDLGGIFGIELEAAAEPVKSKPQKTPAKKASAKAPKATASPKTITSQELIARGVPNATFQNWVRAGVLLRTAQRGVYETTKETESKIAAHLARNPLGRPGRRPSF